MNKRQRMKYNRFADCGHRVCYNTCVMTDPYPIYDSVDFCKLGVYDGRRGECKCTQCRHFVVPREYMRLAMLFKKQAKRGMIWCSKHQTKGVYGKTGW